MVNKLDFEGFKIIKKQLIDIINEADKYFNEHSNNEGFNYEKEIVEVYFEKIFKLQDYLLSFDLSEIPFEAWDGLTLLLRQGQVLDFSKTKANLNFDLFNLFKLDEEHHYSDKGDMLINCYGCNVRNIPFYELSDVDMNNIFDEETRKQYPALFLSSLFSSEFRLKYYGRKLEIYDIISLSSEQLNELKGKNMNRFLYSVDRFVYESLLDKMIELYNYSKQDFQDVIDIFRTYGHIIHEYEILNANVADIKYICYTYIEKQIFEDEYYEIKLDLLPKSFVRDSKDILLIDENISDELRERFYSKTLTIDDVVLNYPLFKKLFKTVSVRNFLAYDDKTATDIINYLTIDELVYLYQKYPDVLKYIMSSQKNLYFFVGNFTGIHFNHDNKNTLEEKFINAIKLMASTLIKSGQEIPLWLQSMNFSYVGRIKSHLELMEINESTVILDVNQQKSLNYLNLEYMKKFDQDTRFFTYNFGEMLNHFHTLIFTLSDNRYKDVQSYSMFVERMKDALISMRKRNYFTDLSNYDYIYGTFREMYPELFMDNAPYELRYAFFQNRITPKFLSEHKEYIKYLVDMDLSDVISVDIMLRIQIIDKSMGNDWELFNDDYNFISEYAKRYGNLKLLNLLALYGKYIDNIALVCDEYEMDNEELINKKIRDSIYEKIINLNDVSSKGLINNSLFVSEHPDLFVDFSNLGIPEGLESFITDGFYTRNLSFTWIKKYPQLILELKDKNLKYVFSSYFVGDYEKFLKNISNDNMVYTLEMLCMSLGNEKFLKLVSIYGEYLSLSLKENGLILNKTEILNISSDDEIDFKYLCEKIEENIVNKCMMGDISYSEFDIPDFLKEKHPEFYLKDGAPLELLRYAYEDEKDPYRVLVRLKDNYDEWWEYLNPTLVKIIVLRSLKNVNSWNRDDAKKRWLKYFDMLGEESAVKLAISSKINLVNDMVNTNKVELMVNWYNRTGRRFIPDIVVMDNFSLSEADKFLTNGKVWSNLMKIERFSIGLESRDALLKLAYSFGAFDHDEKGIIELHRLLSALPRKISADYGSDILDIREDFEYASEEERKRNWNYFWDNKYDELFRIMQGEGMEFDELPKNLFDVIYRKNEDGSYSLRIKQQKYPKTCEYIRELFEDYRNFLDLLSPDKLHQLFGGFALKYDKDFREFLLTNMKEISENPEYVTYIANIQKQFSEIKAFNSNRTLTLDLAVNYVKNNNYQNVEVGNEKVSEISSIAGYSQDDFDTLQQIYNYGKQRTFSSIPRISKTFGKYSYEMLKLDDPLAMAIGTLTDCCQELGNAAEVCMEHSMTSSHGRVFVIRDEYGNIVAQSWVWRNGNVLCFDNIEIPDKAFKRAMKEYPQIGREGFADEVFGIYKQAAHDLIYEDEVRYKKYLEEGIITKEQHDGLRLGKITVGSGYNDIAESLKRNAMVDDEMLARPLYYSEPVSLSRGLYTNDSKEQYVLEEREGREDYVGETLLLHNDEYTLYDDSNFDIKNWYSFKKLEVITREYSSLDDYEDEKHLVTEIATYYDMNPDTTRIIMHPNFSIVFDVYKGKIRIGELLFNKEVNLDGVLTDIEDKVIIQIKLALEQIGNDKEFDISLLDDDLREMYKKVMNLTDKDMNIERGIEHDSR